MCEDPESILQKFVHRSEVTGEPLGLAVSGGRDSMAMLDTLRRLEAPVTAIHINHQLRGIDSDQDAEFIRNYCLTHGLACFVQRVNVVDYSRIHKRSLEESARILRYQSMADWMVKLKIRHLLIAHHAEDNIETFLLRLLRGTGIHGLAVMDQQAGFPFPNFLPPDFPLHLWRPWIRVPGNLIQALVHDRNIPFRTDDSNRNLTFRRNRIRHQLIPALDQVEDNRPWRSALMDFMSICSQSSDFLKSCATQWLSTGHFNQITEFHLLPPALQYEVVRLQLQASGHSHSLRRVRSLLDSQGNWIQLTPGEMVRLLPDGHLRISPFTQLHAPQFSSLSLTVDISRGPGRVEFEGLTIQWEKLSHLQPVTAQISHLEHFDADTIGDLVILRFWQPGDDFHPSGYSREFKLKKWFSSQKVDRLQRHLRVIAECPGRGIFWIEGMRIAEWARCSPTTQKSLLWRFNRGHSLQSGT
ncbi:MAG: tRNA lysidine(34) synthetase TilS [Verrucomicrobia bacterium]|nr:tRNA lysidine(34) synthetase TilS [Verrucomicrobiota bacterium]